MPKIAPIPAHSAVEAAAVKAPFAPGRFLLC